MRRTTVAAIVVLVAIVVASCNSDGTTPPDLSTTLTTLAASPPTSAAVEAVSSATAGSTTTTTPPTTATTPTTTTTTTSPPDNSPSPVSLLITNEEGVFVVTLEGEVSQLVTIDQLASDGYIDFATDDTRGGILIQRSWMPFGFTGADSIVYWVPHGSSAPQELLVPTAEQNLAVEDVVAQGETVMVYYTRSSGTTIDTAEQRFRRFDLDAKTVTDLGVVGGWESAATPISVGGHVILTNSMAEGFQAVVFTDLEGVHIESPANPIPDMVESGSGWFFGGDLSPDGSVVAFKRWVEDEAGYRHPEIEIRDVLTGELILGTTLPGSPALVHIGALDLTDGYVLVNEWEEGSKYPTATVVDIASDGEVRYQAPIHGVARFLRSIPDLDGVVSWP